jgi:hypothetical protein
LALAASSLFSRFVDHVGDSLISDRHFGSDPRHVALCVIVGARRARLAIRTIGNCSLAAVLILAAGFAYMHVDKEAYTRAASPRSRPRKFGKLRRAHQDLNEASEADAKRAAAENADRIAKLESQVNDTPPNAQRCLDRAGAGRVRNIK